jgi:hypothetical protein
MITVHLTGAKFLPRTVDAERLCDAVLDVGEQLGIDRKVRVEVRPWASNTQGLAIARKRGTGTIVLYDKAIRRWAGYTRTTHIRSYSVTLAHELVHLSQEARGSKALTLAVAEREADRLEAVYGPEVERWLRG